MGNTRWWDIAVVTTAAVLAVLLLANDVTGWRLAGALVVIALLMAVWFALGRTFDEGGTRATASAVLVVVLAGVGTAITPSMATIQVIAFPLIWYFSVALREAVLANVLLGLSVGTGYFLSTGATTSAFFETLLVEAISVGGSLAIGLWISSISTESAGRQRVLVELRETQDLLAAVSRDAGAMGERERLAREIHDTIAQDLTGLVLLTQRARRELDAGGGMVGETLDLLEDGARSALAETRSLVATSAPVGLADDVGLADAVRRLGDRFARETSVAVTVEAGGLPAADRDTEVVLLRCTQEALANVRKHARASTVSIVLGAADGIATLEVRDDGVGFDASAPSDGFGLAGLRDRLGLVGGTLDIVSSPGHGTTLVASLPLHERVTA
jgi:signal transduction histidine kinase